MESGALRGHWHIPSKNLPKYPPPLLGRSYPLNIFINLSGEGGVPALYLPVRRLLHSPIERERLIVGYSNRHKKF